jgi:fructokinase
LILRKHIKVLSYNRDDNDVWNKVGYYLGVCCSKMILTLSVEKIIIGGGVMNREILYDLIRKHCFESLNGYISHPKLESVEALK